MQSDFRTPETIIQENNFICGLMNNSSIYIFANKMLFNILKKAKEYNLGMEEIIKVIDSTFVENKNAISKSAYKCNQNNICVKLVNIVLFNDFLQFNINNRISFSQIMGALFLFHTNNKLLKLFIDNNPKLQKKFMNAMNRYFSVPKSMDYRTVCSIIDSSPGMWFYGWALTYIIHDKKNLFHSNLNDDPEYIRVKNKEFNYNLVDVNNLTSCKKNNLKNFNEQYMVLADTYKTPVKQSFWYKLMKLYRKQIISGPSGSSAICYQLFFDISGILKPTKRNKVMFLLCVLADYYEYFHGISEVLQQYSVSAKLKKYDLSNNDLMYVGELMKGAKLT